jgi:hypothetical protein
MKAQEIEAAISKHAEAVDRFLKAKQDDGQNLAELIEVEYPVDPVSSSYRFMGFVELFQDQGGVETGRAGSWRHVVRKSL